MRRGAGVATPEHSEPTGEVQSDASKHEKRERERNQTGDQVQNIEKMHGVVPALRALRSRGLE